MAKVDWGSVYILSLNSSYQTCLQVLPFKFDSRILLAKKQEELEQSELEHWLSYEASDNSRLTNLIRMSHFYTLWNDKFGGL